MASSATARLFGPAVRQARRDAGLTQEKLAERAGLHPTYLGMIERGTRNPTLAVAESISAALGIPLWLFLKRSSRKSPDPASRRRKGHG